MVKNVQSSCCIDSSETSPLSTPQSPTNFPVRSFEIECFKLRAAILDECQTYLGVALNPNVHPPGTYKTKMAFHTSKRSILTILRNEKMGDYEQKNHFNEDLSVKSIFD